MVAIQEQPGRKAYPCNLAQEKKRLESDYLLNVVIKCDQWGA